MNILAIDPAIKTGYAIRGESQYSGVEDFSKNVSCEGDLFLEFRNWLLNALYIDDIEFIAVEAPTPVNMHSAKIQYGLLSVVKMIACSEERAYLEFYPAQIQKFVRDYLLIDPRAAAEAKMLFKHCKQSKNNSLAYFYLITGKMPEDDNEADAFALCDYALQEQKRLGREHA